MQITKSTLPSIPWIQAYFNFTTNAKVILTCHCHFQVSPVFFYILKKKLFSLCYYLNHPLAATHKNSYVCRARFYIRINILEVSQYFCSINFLRNLQNLPHYFRLYFLISFSGKRWLKENLDIWICKIAPVLYNVTLYFFIVTGALTPYYTIPYNKSIIP